MKDKVYMFICSSFHFICYGIPNLALGILALALKMIIPSCLSDVLQPAV